MLDCLMLCFHSIAPDVHVGVVPYQRGEKIAVCESHFERGTCLQAVSLSVITQ